MDIMQIGVQLLSQKLGGNISQDLIGNALQNFLGNQQQNQSQGGQQNDLAGLVSTLSSQSGGLGDVVQSWLGDGDNQKVSGNQLQDVFGNKQMADFASQLGVSDRQASEGLAEALPQMVDKSSSGGNLLDQVGGIGGALNIAKNLFGR